MRQAGESAKKVFEAYLCGNHRDIATNSGLGGQLSSNRDLFFFGPSLFLHRVNNIEHHIKQNIYTVMEVISVIPP